MIDSHISYTSLSNNDRSSFSCKKTSKTLLTCLGIGLSYASLYPDLKVVWRNDKPTFEDMTAGVGVLLTFGTLMSWEYVKFFNDLFNDSENTSSNNISRYKKSLLVASSIALGIFSRLPGVGVTLQVSALPQNEKIFWAILSVLGQCSPSIKSMYDTLLLCHTCHSLETEENTIVEEEDWPHLKKLTFALQILLAAIPTTLLHIQNTLLTKEALEGLGNQNIGLGVCLGALSALCFAKEGYQVSWKNVDRLVIKVSKPDKSLIIEVLALFISLMPSKEIGKIADRSSTGYPLLFQALLKYGNIISLTLIVQKPLSILISNLRKFNLCKMMSA